jgi:hypothetical protein
MRRLYRAADVQVVVSWAANPGDFHQVLNYGLYHGYFPGVDLGDGC